MLHPTEYWRVMDLWIVRTIGHDMTTAQGLIIAPYRILEGSEFLPFRILEGGEFQ